MPPSESLRVDLTADEETLLVFGMLDWDGPANPTDAVARALGFSGVENLLSEGARIAQALRAHQALDVADWTRALASASLIFGSDLLGIGDEWTSIHGHDDQYWLSLLRRLHLKVPLDRSFLGQ